MAMNTAAQGTLPILETIPSSRRKASNIYSKDSLFPPHSRLHAPTKHLTLTSYSILTVIILSNS